MSAKSEFARASRLAGDGIGMGAVRSQPYPKLPHYIAAFCLALLGIFKPPIAAIAADEELLPLPRDLPHNYGVIGVQVRTNDDTLVVRKVNLHGPAHRAGLRVGDRVIGALPFRMRTADEFSRFIKSLNPDTPVTLQVDRQGESLEISCEVTDRRRLYFLMGEQGTAPGAIIRDRHRRWGERRDRIEEAVLSLAQRQGVSPELRDLKAVFAMEVDRYGGDCRLSDVQYALLNPLKGSQMAVGLAGEVDGAPSLPTLLAVAAEHLDLTAGDEGTAAKPRLQELLGQVGGGLLPDLLTAFFSAGLRAEKAFAALKAGEREELFAHIPLLLARFGKTRYLDGGDSLETEVHINTLRQAKRGDLAARFDAARTLTRLTDPAALQRIRSHSLDVLGGQVDGSLPPAFRGDFLLARHTEWGWILVGGKGANHYGGDAALIVDLGGDDTYVNNCGAPTFVSAYSIYDTEHGERRGSRRQIAPVGLIIDYGGDDRYIGNGVGAVGAAVGGIGLLVDLAGDDLYQGTELTQGAAFCGIGMLWDRRGRDVYAAQAGAQGAAFFGAGLLVDRGGEDFYSATLYSQAFGGTRGFGMLYDNSGDDRYVADRKVPSGYGTEGIFSGWSQGAACGFRGYSSGGIGLLVDAGGNDDYQAGNFSQGMGYFFGMGALVDFEGDDVYRGTRFTQGASAHQAIGVLVDLGGDDEYYGQIAANQGGAWDVGVAILEDSGVGNDSYHTLGGLAQGSAAMNGLGILLDRGGRDRYEAGSSAQGDGGSTSYWGGRGALNLGILIDEGGEEDEYSLQGRGDDTELKTTAVGLFRDQ